MSVNTHKCPCGCGAQIARHKLACRAGWYRLPKPLRDKIGFLYRAGAPARLDHLLAVREARIWFADNPAVTS